MTVLPYSVVKALHFREYGFVTFRVGQHSHHRFVHAPRQAQGLPSHTHILLHPDAVVA